jgi:hypothetical protein
MSKKSNGGKHYFHAKGKRDRLTFGKDVISQLAAHHRNIYQNPDWAANAYINGYNGYGI